MNVNMTDVSTVVNVFLEGGYNTAMSLDLIQTCCAPVMQADLSSDEAEALAERFKAIADPVRLQIVSRLAHASEGVCVCDLVDGLDRSQPTISHHLKVLANAGLVRREQRGRRAWYSLDAEQFEALRGALAAPR